MVKWHSEICPEYIAVLYSTRGCESAESAMSYNYSQSFIEDLLGFSEYESAPVDAEWAPLGHGQFSVGTFPNATPIPDDSNTSRSLNAKVPIPRTSTPGIAKAHGRVSRACEACREQKAKCSGHQPTCNRCAQSGAKCSYGDRKREKIIKYVLRNN